MLTTDKAEQLVEKYGARLADCISEGFKHAQDAINTKPVVGMAVSPSARAHLVNCMVCHFVKLAFREDILAGRVELNDELGFFYLNIEGVALVRFKKFGSNGLPSNIRTRQQKRIYSHTKNMFGPSMASATWLFAGYTTDEVSVVSTELKCIREEQVVWSLPLRSDASVAIDLAAEQVGEPKRKVRQRVRKSARRSKERRAE